MPDQQPTALLAPLKKAWINPEITLISRNDTVSAAKHITNVKESTGVSVQFATHLYFSNPIHTFHIKITKNAAPYGNKSSAVS